MKKISLADNVLYPLTLTIGFILRKLPIEHALRIGRRIGGLIYSLYTKRRSVAYANLKAAFGHHTKPRQLKNITKKAFQNLTQTGIEVLRFPAVDKAYINKYMRFESLEEIAKAGAHGKGVIVLTAHFGNWELSSLGGALHGYPQDVFVRQQKHSKLNALLNNYRALGGRHVITKGLATRELIRALRENRTVSILTDQDGGWSGYLVEFFGRLASTPGGAISFALKLGSKVLPHFAIREKGPKHLVIIDPPMELISHDDRHSDIQVNLQQFTDILQHYITKYPQQWLWLHKRWKTSPSRRVSILSDGKAGHLNQSLAIARQLEKATRQKAAKDPRVSLLREIEDKASSSSYDIKPGKARLDQLIYSQKVINVRFKNKFFKYLLNLCSLFASPRCQGCMRCLKICLSKDSYREVIFNYADVLVSCGSALAGVNRFLAMENNAKSVVAMKPGIASIRKFNLVVMPKHDKPRKSRNVVITDGAPNSVDPEYLSGTSNKLKLNLDEKLTIGLFIGGNTRRFNLGVGMAADILEQAIAAAEKLDAQLLVTTSRRTSKYIEELFKKKLSGYDRCKLLVLANQANVPGTMPAMLAASQILVVSGESISMVSEAASCGNKATLVFEPEYKKTLLKRISRDRHKSFLKNLASKKQIILVKPKELSSVIYKLWQNGQTTEKLNDSKAIYEAVKNLI